MPGYSTAPTLPATAETLSIMRTTPSSKTTPPVTSLTFRCAPPETTARSGGEKPEDCIDTPLDRCKDIEVGSEATVYATLTNYAKHDTFYGQLLGVASDLAKVFA